MDDAEMTIAAGHIIVIGDIASALNISSELLDQIGGPYVRVTRTVLRSELLRTLVRGPLDLIITASNATLMHSDQFVAAFSARVVPVAMLILGRPLDERLLLRLRAGSVEPELLVPPIDHATLREHVHKTLHRRRTRSIAKVDPLHAVVRRAREQLGTHTLRVRAGAEHGSLTFVEGVLVTAHNTRLIGDGAAVEILQWQHTSVVVEGVVLPVEYTVTRELDALLGEVYANAPSTTPQREPRAPDPILPIIKPHGPTTTNNNNNDSNDRESSMANINKTLEETMKIDGAIGAAIADWDSGLCLGVAGGGSRLNIEVAAAGNCQVVKAKMATMQELGIHGAIQDILITLDDQIHLLRPLRRGESMFIYLAIDKAKGNLAMARHRLTKLESELVV